MPVVCGLLGLFFAPSPRQARSASAQGMMSANLIQIKISNGCAIMSASDRALFGCRSVKLLFSNTKNPPDPLINFIPNIKIFFIDN
jgi:hypothetical protein